MKTSEMDNRGSPWYEVPGLVAAPGKPDFGRWETRLEEGAREQPKRSSGGKQRTVGQTSWTKPKWRNPSNTPKAAGRGLW